MKTPSLKSLTANKDTKRTSQLKTIFQYLTNHIATASMVCFETGVPQKNFTRFKRDLELSNRLWEIEKKHCKQTGFKAFYLTTDPNKAPNLFLNQLTLF